MPIEPFRFADVRELLAPYLARASRREAVRVAGSRREADRARGVAWSGLAADRTAPRSEQQLHDEAAAALADAQAFAASLRGRFLAALQAVERAGHAASAERARAAYNRGFADPLERACPAEIGVALSVLARLDAPPAHDACLALAELLSATLNLAAE